MAGPYVAAGFVCRRCRSGKPAYDRAAGVARYRSPIRELALSLKFAGDRPLALAMAAAMARRVRALGLPRADAVAPVPLHRSRLRARGYNQAAWLSMALARQLGYHHAAGGLERAVATDPQAGKSGDRRRLLPAGIFAADPRAWRGKNVLLVDDVMTTGATVHSCARTLRNAGAARVDVIVFAR